MQNKETITFNNYDIDFILKDKTKIRNWISQTIHNEGKTFSTISYVFCSKEHIIQINKQFLKHNYSTDIITFPYTENERVSGDIFICIPQVKENAFEYRVSFQQELLRVLIHGILHLLGYDDHKNEEIEMMRSKEDFYLAHFLPTNP